MTLGAEGRLIERWFGLLTDQLIRRGVHQSVVALENDVRAWINNWNQDPKPFVWTKTAEDILQSLSKYIAKTSDAGHWPTESGDRYDQIDSRMVRIVARVCSTASAGVQSRSMMAE